MKVLKCCQIEMIEVIKDFTSLSTFENKEKGFIFLRLKESSLSLL